jgi:hypothetical protein
MALPLPLAEALALELEVALTEAAGPARDERTLRALPARFAAGGVARACTGVGSNAIGTAPPSSTLTWGP